MVLRLINFQTNKNMKQFNLQEALNGKPICTRSGCDARLISYVPEADGNYKVVALCEGEIITTCEAGLVSAGLSSDCDLFMSDEKTVVYVNVYPADVSHSFGSLQDAISCRYLAITVNKITISEDGSLTSEVVHTY